jgi:hypothetical protein
MFANMQINSNKTKHEHVPIETDHSSLVGVLYRSLHRDQQGKKGSLFPEAKQI